MGRGEIARHESCLLFPHCFQKTCTAETFKPGLVREKVKQRKKLGGKHYQKINRTKKEEDEKEEDEEEVEEGG